MKRLLSWLLVLTMLVACLPMSVIPALAVETGVDTSEGSDLELPFDELLPTEPEFGTAENPYVIPEGNPRLGTFVTITVPAGGEVYATADCSLAAKVLFMNTYDGAYNVVYNPKTGMSWAAQGNADDGYSINEELQAGGVHNLLVRNPGEEEISIMAYLSAVQNPGSSWELAVQLVEGDNVSTHAAGSAEFYYTYTAPADGTLTLNFSSTAGGWFYTVNNLSSYAYGDGQWSDSDPVVNPAKIEVAAGDVLQIVVNTYDPANPWAAPAGTVTVNASFEAAVVAPEYNVVTSGYGLSLDAELIVSAKFLVPEELRNDPNATMTIGFINDEIEVNLMEYIAENGLDSKNRFVVKQSVKSPYMTHLINVTITDGNGYTANYTDYFGETFTGTYQFGAENYVKLMSAQPETVQNAVRALLTYGAYAQEYFSKTGTQYITEELATEILTRNGYEAYDMSGFSSDLLTQVPVGEGDDFDGISVRNSQPDLAAAIFMKVQFNASGLTSADDIANYTYKLHVVVGDQNIELDLDTPEWDSSRKRLVFYVYGIPAMFFDNMYTITITKTTTGETYSGSTSIFTYMNVAYDTFSSNVEMQNLLKAMYYYNEAANIHFGK